LYQCDTLEDWTAASIELYFSNFLPQLNGDSSKGERDNHSFSRRLCLGVVEQIVFVDSQIASASQHWSISRMSRVDRNILRCAVYELAFEDDIPVSVSLNEAIEIAKRYGADESPQFINGVLDNVARTLQERPELVAEASQEKIAVGE
jgi:N utilization substance protein B